MYRVFLSYSTSRDEMVVVWRLQTLAAASGLHLDVPNPVQRSDWTIISQMIEQADIVIALITQRSTAQVNKELEFAISKGKRIIPIIEQGVSIRSLQNLLQRTATQVFWLDPRSPWKMEEELTHFLQKEKVNKEGSQAILAVAGVAIGLLLLQDLTKS